MTRLVPPVATALNEHLCQLEPVLVSLRGLGLHERFASNELGGCPAAEAAGHPVSRYGFSGSSCGAYFSASAFGSVAWPVTTSPHICSRMFSTSPAFGPVGNGLAST